MHCISQEECANSVNAPDNIQALERAQGYIRLPSGRAVTGFAHEYERHGTTTLFAALETATGLVKAWPLQTAPTPGVFGFHERGYRFPRRRQRNSCHSGQSQYTQARRWLKSHPNVHFHFTPTHASWLNQIECRFSILRRQALQGASFVDVKQLREAIDNFISAYNAKAAPFEWRQGEIKQQGLRDNITDFCK